MWLKHIKLSFIKALRLLCQINSTNMITNKIGRLRQARRLPTDPLMLQLMELLVEVLAEIMLRKIGFCVLLQIHVFDLFSNKFDIIC